jgi:glucosamine 6-phosphate synthetase-like amidotransferase/phosphosugar isomerase protein
MTLREIYSQPEVWRDCLKTLDGLDLQPLVGDKDPRSYQWLFVGCGTSYHLTQAAAATFTMLAGAAARAVPASEILLFPELAVPDEHSTLFSVLISRSGHTSEVLRVAEYFSGSGVEFLPVTCDGNELAGLTRRTLNLPVIEKSTVMTASFTSMLIALQYVAARFARKESFLAALNTLPESLAELLSLVDIFLPNEDEACRISGERDAESAIAALAKRIPLVAVKCGKRGSLVQAGGKRWLVPAEPVTPVDTIGAGDSYDAGFLTAYLNGDSPEACAAFGNHTAALSTLRPGGTESFRDASLMREFLFHSV